MPGAGNNAQAGASDGPRGSDRVHLGWVVLCLILDSPSNKGVIRSDGVCFKTLGKGMLNSPWPVQPGHGSCCTLAN